MSKWVDAVLRGDHSAAKDIANQMSSPPVLSGDISTVSRWLREKRRGLTRAGLVASSGAARLRPDGLETSFDFHQRFEWERWFLDRDSCEEADCEHKYCNDVRASSKLEVAATQFEIQGLELDWIGICWGEDLLWSGTEWRSRSYNGKLWKANKDGIGTAVGIELAGFHERVNQRLGDSTLLQVTRHRGELVGIGRR